MNPKTRRMLRWIVLGTAGSLLLAIAALFIAGQSARSRLAMQFPAPGVQVDVGGYRLHLHCQGQGPVTVLLEAGLNDFSLQWFRLQPRLVKVTRTCSYDRAGLGWSEAAPGPPKLDQAVADLHALLHGAGEMRPLVLVGHSFGGVLVRRFQQLYPDSVRGMVLVDAASEHQAQRIAGYPRLLQDTAQQFRVLERLASFGLMALSPDSIPARSLTGEALARYRAVLASRSFFGAAAAETHALLANLEALRAHPHMARPAPPVVVISRGRSDPLPGMTEAEGREFDRTWREMQAALVGTVLAQRHLIAESSGHYIQLEQPELIEKTVRDLLGALL